MQIPRLMIAAPQGCSGKTTVTIGLCAALRKRGLRVKPFKKGPDYIDPSWLGAAAGTSCSNLDPFMFDEPTLRQGFQQSCPGADIAVIEAAMGLYDSSDPDGKGSSAWLSRLLNVPVILVINSARMTRSAAAMINGYVRFEPDTNIAGVILNNVAGKRHEDKLVKSIAKHCGIPVLGCIPRDAGLSLRERHLGIIPFIEQDGAAEIIDRACEVVEGHIDLDRLIEIARSSPDKCRGVASAAPVNRAGLITRPYNAVIASSAATWQSQPTVKIALLYDKAFSFYYPENLESLREAGAELIYIDSFTGRLPGDIDGLYIGGGFPELYPDELEANTGLRRDIAEAADKRLPIYAECAGLMYLCRCIIRDGRKYEMCGVIASDVEIGQRPRGHGYTMVEVEGENPFFPKGTALRGHEFHYSKLTGTEGLNFAYKVKRGQGIDGKVDGIVYKNALASYTHLHAWSVPFWADNFVKLAATRQIETRKIAV